MDCIDKKVLKDIFLADEASVIKRNNNYALCENNQNKGQRRQATLLEYNRLDGAGNLRVLFIHDSPFLFAHTGEHVYKENPDEVPDISTIFVSGNKTVSDHIYGQITYLSIGSQPRKLFELGNGLLDKCFGDFKPGDIQPVSNMSELDVITGIGGFADREIRAMITLSQEAGKWMPQKVTPKAPRGHYNSMVRDGYFKPVEPKSHLLTPKAINMIAAHYLVR